MNLNYQFDFEVALTVAGADYNADLRMEYRITDGEIDVQWVGEIVQRGSSRPVTPLSPFLVAIFDGMDDDIMAAALAAHEPPTDDDRETDK